MSLCNVFDVCCMVESLQCVDRWQGTPRPVQLQFQFQLHLQLYLQLQLHLQLHLQLQLNVPILLRCTAVQKKIICFDLRDVSLSTLHSMTRRLVKEDYISPPVILCAYLVNAVCVSLVLITRICLLGYRRRYGISEVENTMIFTYWVLEF